MFRITLIAVKITDHQTQSAVDTVTSVLSSFLLYLVPLTVVTIAAIQNSRLVSNKHIPKFPTDQNTSDICQSEDRLEC